MPQALFQLPDGQQAAFEIPEAGALRPELQAAGQAATAMPSGSPLPGIAQAAQAGGQMVQDFAAQEGLPSALAAAAPVVLQRAFPAAGLAARLAAGGIGALAGRQANVAAGVSPPQTLMQQAAEFLSGMGGELPAGVFDPSDAQQIVGALAKRGGVSKTLRANEAQQAIGGALRRRVSDIDGQARTTLNNMYRKVEALASAAGASAQPSEPTLRAVQTVSEAMGDLGLTTPEKLRVQTALTRLIDDKPLDFAEMRKVWREVGELGDGFAKTLGRGPRNPLNTLAGSIKNDLRQMVAGTPAERRFEAADNYYVNDYLPTTRAVRNIDNAAPEDVVNALVKKPAHLRQVLSRVSPETATQMRTAWIADAIETTRDNTGLPDIKLLNTRLKALKGSARRLVIEDHASFNRTTNALEALIGRQDFLNQFRLLQSPVLVGMGSGVGAALATGNIPLGIAAMVATNGGVRALARIMHDPRARRLFAKGLARERTDAQLASRFILQAGTKAGVDWLSPELQFSGAPPA